MKNQPGLQQPWLGSSWYLKKGLWSSLKTDILVNLNVDDAAGVMIYPVSVEQLSCYYVYMLVCKTS